MNRLFAERIILSLKDNLEKQDMEFDLYDDMRRAEMLFGKELPAIVDCVNEARNYGKTTRRNAQIIIDLMEMKLAEQALLSFDLEEFKIDDTEFCNLIEKAFRLYKEGEIDISTQKLWDAFERIKTYYLPKKKKSSEELIEKISKGNSPYRDMLDAEFEALTKIGNRFRIRHHENGTADIKFSEHYDYFFHRCLALVKLATTIINEEKEKEA